jgi:adenylate cyclase
MSEAPLVYAFGPYVLDAARRKLTRGGQPIALTPKAFDVLVLLVRNDGRVVEKEAILRDVWPDTIVDEGNLAFQISTLRKVVGAELIATVPGRGYQLAAPVQPGDAVEIVVEERTTASVTTEVRRFAVVVLVLVVAAMVLGVWFLKRNPDPPAGKGTIESLAVLPFTPIVASQRDEALEIGMADALIARISRLKTVAVRPLASVRGFAGLDRDPIAAGRALGVDAVLEGSILNANGRIRVQARLLRVADGRQIWHGQFDQAGADIFSVQESISVPLADAVAPNLTADERSVLRRPDTGNREAYRAYTLGRALFFHVRSDRFDRAVEHFEEAVKLDPSYAKAWAALAETHAVLPISSDRPSPESFVQARKAAARALELDPQLADAHSVMGSVAFYYEWDWKESERRHRLAIALNPNDGWYRFKYAHLLSNTGRHEEAQLQMAEALALEPYAPMINTMAAQVFLHAERYDLAERQLTHTLQIAPDFWIAHLVLGKVLERTGRREAARSHYETARRGSGENVEPLSMLAHLSAIEGKTAEAQARIEEMLAIRKARYFTPSKLALPYAGLGNRDEAFRWLQRACAERDVGLLFIDVNPRWKDAGMRDDPRWKAVADCVKLPAVPRGTPQ